MSKSINFIVFFALLNVLLFTSSCLSTKKFMGYQEVKIIDSGELYSTYNFSVDDISELSIKLNAAKIEEIKKYATEENWPSGIRSLDARDLVRTSFIDFKTYQVAYFNKKYLLIIPSEKNKHMPAELQSDHDIYFVIGESGISK